MDLSYIRTFLHIVEVGNVAKAAEDLKYAQSTVTSQIHALEQELGVTLFERIGRKNQLTPAGYSFLQHAFDINNAMLKLSDFISRLAETEFKDTPIVAYGPFEAPIYKLDGRYRMRMVFKCKLTSKTRELFARVMRESGKSVSKRISLAIDINPSNV